MRTSGKLLCPVCDEPTEVYDTQLQGAGVQRRRRCPNGHRFNTFEEPIGTAWDQHRQVVPFYVDDYDKNELEQELAAEGVKVEGEDSRIQGRTPHL